MPSFRRHPDVQVAAVYDRTVSRAERLATENNAVAFDDLTTFLRSGLDLVSICTPPWTHAEIAREALGEGVHVFTEKPMAMNEAEAVAMATAAKAADRLLCVSHNFIFSRSARKADSLLRKIGDVRTVMGLQLSSHARRLPDWYKQLPGGLLMDESPHMLYTLRHFLGEMSLRSSDASKTTSGDLATVSLNFAAQNGDGHILMVFDAPISEWHVTILGTRGAIDLDLFRDIVVKIPSDGQHKPADILKTSLSSLTQHARGFLSSGALYASKRLYWGHEVIIPKFVDAVLGRGPLPVDLSDALAVVRMTDSVLSSIGLS